MAMTAQDTRGVGPEAPLMLDLGANVDGAWPRPGGEVASEVKRLARVLDGIRVAEAELGPGESLPEASLPLELFCQGARDASAWTLGLSSAGPFHPGALPVSNATVELTVLSCRYLSTLGTELSLFAVGALAWLEWLISERESIDYPTAA
jgi:hypothetical protein